MSAIYGIFNKNGSPLEEVQLNALKRAMQHRATDGEGIWENRNVAFGFCKLTVHSRQKNEQLPIEADDFVLTADARIDNRDELYTLLGLDKRQCQAEADSYLILKAYQKWGESCVDYLEGEFVFAIWNKVSQRLFMATDQIGFRPVYYYDGPDFFVFCSEIKGIEAVKTTPNYFNHQYFVNNQFRQGDSALTFNTEILALGGANTLVLAHNKVQLKKYWTLENRNTYNFSTPREWIDCMRHLMYKAVEKRFDPEQPVGVTLSGGLDSSSIACILAELLAKKNKPLYAFSSVLPVNRVGVEVDERKYIEIVNQHYPNIIQTFVEAPNVGPFDHVSDAFSIEETIPNAFFYMDHALFLAAQQKGIRSLLTGFGGDYWASWKANTVLYMLMQQGNYRAAFNVLRETAAKENQSKLSLLRRNYLSHTKAWKQLRKLKPETTVNWQQYTALQPDFVTKYSKKYDFKTDPNHRFEMREELKMGRISSLAGLFANRNAAYGISSGDPMFDKDLFEFLMEAPVQLFTYKGWRRSLIRHAMDGILPPEIQWRTDKLPYNPDFVQRIIDGKEKLYSMIESDEYKFIFEDFLSKTIITKHFDEIRPYAGFSGETSTMSIRIAQAGIAYQVLAHLFDKNYRF